MKQIVFSLTLTLLLVAKSFAQPSVNIIVNNPTDQQRREVVSINADRILERLIEKEPSSIAFYKPNAQQIPHQYTHDHKFLLYVSVQPHGKAQFVARRGKPQHFPLSVFGKRYDFRVDDLAWENDLCAYRLYGPALQRTGEQSFGIDVWVKNTPHLVVPERYDRVMQGNGKAEGLKKAGYKEAADSTYREVSLHLDHGNGMDGYGVGPTLGCGTPAFFNGKHLIYPYSYQHCEILDNGPLRFTVNLTYGPADLPGNKGVVEHRIISLDKGSHFNHITVWYDNVTTPLTFATGVVLHGQTDRVKLGKNFLQYADPTDRPNIHNSEIYVGCIFPEAGKTSLLKADKATGQNVDHAIWTRPDYRSGQRINYWFGAGWSNYDVPTQAHWQLLIDEFMAAQAHPLSVSIE